jgi:hypothetical protein
VSEGGPNRESDISVKPAGEPDAGGQHVNPSLIRRVRNWFIDFLVTSAIVLPVAWLFEQVTEPERLHVILSAQDYAYKSVEKLDPQHLIDYLIDTALYIEKILPSWALPDKHGIVLLTMIGAPLLLPIAVIVEGGFFELLMVFVIFLPLCTMIRSVEGSSDSGGWSTIAAGTFALLLTTLFFWMLKLAMLGALYEFGKVVKMAQGCVGGTGFGYCIYWSLVRKSEHSITESVLHAITKSVFKSH